MQGPDGWLRSPPYASTSNFLGGPQQSLEEMITLLAAANMRDIELGFVASCPDSVNDDLLRLQATYGCTFLVHNYFPPPRDPFVLNLASTDRMILTKSRELCLRAIDLSIVLGAGFYSVHSGFCFNAKPSDLGGTQRALERIDPAAAEEIFVESLRVLRDHAGGRLQIIIENNVLEKRNLVDGRNVLALGVDSDGLLRLLERAGSNGLGLLIDVGHLSVSAATLGFCREDFLRAVAHKTVALHLSDNDGQHDTNDPVRSESWFWDPVQRYLSGETVCILEAHALRVEEIVEQVTMISSGFAYRQSGGLR